MLEEECRAAGVTLFLNTKIQQVSRTAEFVVRSGDTEFRAARSLWPRADSPFRNRRDLVRLRSGAQFGLNVVAGGGARASAAGGGDRSRYCELTGVSADVVAPLPGSSFGKDADHASRAEWAAILQIPPIGRIRRRFTSIWRRGAA